MINKNDKNTVRKARHQRMRFAIKGTSEKPRLNVYRSLGHIYAQIIDDERGITLVSCNTTQNDIKEKINKLTRKEQANVVGKILGEKAVAKKIKIVVFDRGGYLYTGRVKALADGAREAGLEF